MRLGWLLLLICLCYSVAKAAQVIETSAAESGSLSAEPTDLTPTTESTSSGAGSTTVPQQADEPKTRDMPVVVEHILVQSRAYRQQQNRGDVEADPQLTATAKYFAHYMAKTNRYGHQADGQTPAQRAKTHGYEYCILSENIGYLFSSESLADNALAQRFVDGWIESPEHRDNLLEPAVTQIGVAVAQNEEDGYYFAVQMFGRPESAAIQFELTNETEAVVRYQIDGQTLELPPRYTRIHKRCQTGEVLLLAADEAASEAAEVDEASAQTTFEPQSGDRLVIAEDADGKLQVRQRSAEELQAAERQDASDSPSS